MGSKKTETIKEKTDNSIDPWVQSRLGENYDFARGAAEKPFEPFSGQRYAPFTPAQTEAQGLISGIARDNVGQGTLQSAITAAKTAGGYSPATITAPNITGRGYEAATGSGRSLTDVDLSKYMDPYERQVIDSTMADLDMSRQRQRLSNQADATRAGAWRGDRLGVTDALSDESWGRTLASTLAGLRSQNYQTAAGLAEQDLGREAQFGLTNTAAQNQARQYGAGVANTAEAANADAQMRAQIANQEAGFQAAGLQQRAGEQLGQLSGEELRQAATRASLLSGVGQQQQDFAQQGMDFDWEEFQRRLQYPAYQLQLRNAALGLIPAVTDSEHTGKTTTSIHDPIGQAGTLLQGLGSVGKLFMGGA